MGCPNWPGPSKIRQKTIERAMGQASKLSQSWQGMKMAKHWEALFSANGWALR